MAWACRRCQRVFTDLPENERCPHDDGALVRVSERSLHDEHTGRVCDEKYKIGRLLGAGGMGCVHEAVNLRLDQPVAVKFFSPRYVCQTGRDAAQAAERFRREATVMAKARHPNVVHVLDFSIEGDGTMYIVMELLEGAPLDERLAAGGMTVEQGLGVMAVVLKALEYVHGQGVIHRDLKPSNIFCAEVAGRQTVKVLDFGIARISDSTTITRGPVGTWRYAAPEQLAGEEVDPSADVFSTGVILTEMLTGRPLGKGDTLGDLPSPLNALVRRAISPEASNRYADAREMSLALTGAIGELSDEEREAPLPRFSSGKDESACEEESPAAWSSRPTGGEAPSPIDPTPVVPERAVVVETPPGRHRALALGLILAFAVVGGSTAWILRQMPPSDPPPRADARATGPVAKAAPDADGGLASDDGGTASDADEPTTVAEITVTFVSTPKRAQVLRVGPDGAEEPLCVTHCAHRFPAGTSKIAVLFRADGYGDAEREVELRDDLIVVATLTKASGRVSPAKRQGKTPTSPRGPPPAAASTGEAGYLTIRAIPQSDVFLDGRRIGKSPIAKRSVPAGRHVVKLVPRAAALGPGVSRPTKTLTVVIQPGQTRQIVEYW